MGVSRRFCPPRLLSHREDTTSVERRGLIAAVGGRRGSALLLAGQVAWRLWGRAHAARPCSRFLSHGSVSRSNRAAAAQRGVWYCHTMPSRRTPWGRRKAADLVPASEALSATLQGSGRIATPRQPGSSPGVAAARIRRARGPRRRRRAAAVPGYG
jgi:hypothetical protein